MHIATHNQGKIRIRASFSDSLVYFLNQSIVRVVKDI